MATALEYIGIARMGGGVETGEDNAKLLVKSGKARLLIVASDASDGAKKRAEGYVYGYPVPLIVTPYVKAEISAMAGKAGCSMAAFRDLGLARAFASALFAEYGEPYRETAEELETKWKRAKARGGRKTGNRRKNV